MPCAEVSDTLPAALCLPLTMIDVLKRSGEVMCWLIKIYLYLLELVVWIESGIVS
jgi:hypothetical protein